MSSWTEQNFSYAFFDWYNNSPVDIDLNGSGTKTPRPYLIQANRYDFSINRNREFEDSDLMRERHAQILADPNVRRTLRNTTPQTAEQINRWHSTAQSNLRRVDIIMFQGIPVGHFSYTDANIQHLLNLKCFGEDLLTRQVDGIEWLGEVPFVKESTIGYVISPEYQGRGIATEIVRRYLGHASRSGIELVHAEVVQGNVASTRVLQKNGFQLSGARQDEEGKQLDQYLFDLTQFPYLDVFRINERRWTRKIEPDVRAKIAHYERLYAKISNQQNSE